MNSGIYLIKNVLTNKVYIGKTNNLRRRLREHKNYLNKGVHENRHLQNAWIKYGAESFTFEILELVSCKFLVAFETVYYNYFKSLPGGVYNILGPDYSPKISQETRDRMSASARGNTKRLGKPHSLDSKLAISKSLKESGFLPPTGAKSITIIDLLNGVTSVHKSAIDASAYLEKHPSTVSKYLARKNKKPYLRRWIIEFS